MKNEPLTLRHRIGLEIARKLNNDLLKEHPLKQLFWECTLRCNLHCRHCGSDCKKIAGHPDMPKEDFLKVACTAWRHLQIRIRYLSLLQAANR